MSIQEHYLNKQRVKHAFKNIESYIPRKVRSIEETEFALSKLKWVIDLQKKELGL